MHLFMLSDRMSPEQKTDYFTLSNELEKQFAKVNS